MTFKFTVPLIKKQHNNNNTLPSLKAEQRQQELVTCPLCELV
jgi:hypothetical protein